MNRWPQKVGQFRPERHYDGRIFPCLAQRPHSLPAMLARSVLDYPGNEALVCGDFRCNWQELSDLADAFASGLVARGIGAGDRLILFLDNQAEFVVALFAIARIGAIAVPVGIRGQAPGLAYIAEQSGARAIVHEATLADRIPALPLVVPVTDGDVRAFVQGFARPATPLPVDEPEEESPALIMYTSGTTGRPKGAIVTHLALVHVGAAYAHCMMLGPNDRSACVVPLSHITGISATLCTMAFCGGCMIIVPQFKADAFIALAERERMTHTLMVPAMYNLLLARVDLTAYDLSAWRIGGFGGAPMPVPTIEQMASHLGALQLMNCYGATETCGGVTIMPADALLANSDSVGWPIPGATIRIAGPDGEELPQGQPGELLIGGSTVTPGYWNNPAATQANLIGGFWRSGDLGSIDGKGFVRVLDRLKDMINRGGYKIFTAEVESILMAHPAVLEAAVIAKPCPILGERVHAFICLRDGLETGADELSAYCSTRMTDYKQPESFTIGHHPLPRNLNGKIVKTELRARLDQLATETR
ncbi:class I adenylate-forming enzyme family protein [Sphingobium sp.]|uniref:class I adenylate-forming enzyme family protein n=1 Tax=Sphingobium sp. TaxID=1912891 RepID=UPI0028BD42EA|nr:class I adenylate-forming enzyme family protein [Sphingobium sp.]